MPTNHGRTKETNITRFPWLTLSQLAATESRTRSMAAKRAVLTQQQEEEARRQPADIQKREAAVAAMRLRARHRVHRIHVAAAPANARGWRYPPLMNREDDASDSGDATSDESDEDGPSTQTGVVRHAFTPTPYEPVEDASLEALPRPHHGDRSSVANTTPGTASVRPKEEHRRGEGPRDDVQSTEDLYELFDPTAPCTCVALASFRPHWRRAAATLEARARASIVEAEDKRFQSMLAALQKQLEEAQSAAYFARCARRVLQTAERAHRRQLIAEQRHHIAELTTLEASTRVRLGRFLRRLRQRRGDTSEQAIDARRDRTVAALDQMLSEGAGAGAGSHEEVEALAASHGGPEGSAGATLPLGRARARPSSGLSTHSRASPSRQSTVEALLAKAGSRPPSSNARGSSHEGRSESPSNGGGRLRLDASVITGRSSNTVAAAAAEGRPVEDAGSMAERERQQREARWGREARKVTAAVGHELRHAFLEAGDRAGGRGGPKPTAPPQQRAAHLYQDRLGRLQASARIKAKQRRYAQLSGHATGNTPCDGDLRDIVPHTAYFMMKPAPSSRPPSTGDGRNDDGTASDAFPTPRSIGSPEIFSSLSLGSPSPAALPLRSRTSRRLSQGKFAERFRRATEILTHSMGGAAAPANATTSNGRPPSASDGAPAEGSSPRRRPSAEGRRPSAEGRRPSSEGRRPSVQQRKGPTAAALQLYSGLKTSTGDATDTPPMSPPLEGIRRRSLNTNPLRLPSVALAADPNGPAFQPLRGNISDEMRTSDSSNQRRSSGDTKPSPAASSLSRLEDRGLAKDKRVSIMLAGGEEVVTPKTPKSPMPGEIAAAALATKRSRRTMHMFVEGGDSPACTPITRSLSRIHPTSFYRSTQQNRRASEASNRSARDQIRYFEIGESDRGTEVQDDDGAEWELVTDRW